MFIIWQRDGLEDDSIVSANNSVESWFLLILGAVYEMLFTRLIVVFELCRDETTPSLFTCPPTGFNRTLFSFRSSFYLRTLLLCNKEPTRPRTLPTTGNPLRQLWICTVLLLIGNKSNLFYSPPNVLFGWLQTESVIALSLVLHAVNNNNMWLYCVGVGVTRDCCTMIPPQPVSTQCRWIESCDKISRA